jgi:DNA-binding transcriptional LysR family regulator
MTLLYISYQSNDKMKLFFKRDETSMTLEQLRIFVAVAEREHVGEAARALPLAQSAVSAAVAALERRHGVALFDRVGRRIALTAAGRALLASARGVLANVAAAQTMLEEFGAGVRGALSVFASQTVAGYWLPRHLAGFARRYPLVNVKLAVGNSAEAARAVAEGAADLGFVEDDAAYENLLVETLAYDRLLLVVAPSHPWARLAPDAEALAQGEWVLREAGSGTRAALERALARVGLAGGRLNVALTAPSNEAVRGAVEAGLGATALSASVAAPSLEAGLLVAVPFEIETRRYSALRRPARAAPRVADALLALIRETVGPAR